MDKCCCNTGKTKHRDTAEYKALITRLNKIEGQVRGIKNMVENQYKAAKRILCRHTYSSFCCTKCFKQFQ